MTVHEGDIELSDMERRMLKAFRTIDDPQFTARMVAFMETAAKMVHTDTIVRKSPGNNVVHFLGGKKR